jgi:hypothetical protein
MVVRHGAVTLGGIRSIGRPPRTLVPVDDR